MGKLDEEHICPLCCEELDLSDLEFYPCKCGYQVCMWCWHRIRESETGLCPACRTPYGEDPHQFTALDVDEVLKANKAAQAAAKKERHHANSHHQNTSEAYHSTSDDPLNGTAMEVPKDRTQLANMRVIRRNLVYAVGLPLPIATEEILRKPEYFGQYGKIAKIVLNRSQPTEGGDPRRASASAYVTFQYKQDTLACILALDGFFLEGRNVRASYGTSKYCSAFIKNVRCNNPDCTYLHEMGATEDTFTKQEIQAGYVTSGRDVLARQQQILTEQLQQQQQSAGGTYQLPPRKRTGGGGPSGTGKASTNSVFPQPEFDEPIKQVPPSIPPPVGITRATTVQSTMNSVQLNPATISAKLGRSSSIGVTTATPSGDMHRKTGSIGATTAASVVAAGRKDIAVEAAPPHSTLTALTPLKRPSNNKPSTLKAAPGEEKLLQVRNGKRLGNAKVASGTVGALSVSSGASSLGGQEIDTPPRANAGAIGSSLNCGDEVVSSGVGSLGGLPISLPTGPVHSVVAPHRNSVASLLGGEVYTGSLSGQNNHSSSVIGGSSLLGGIPLAGDVSSTGSSDLGLFRSSSGFWSGSGSIGSNSNTGVIGSHISSNNSDNYGNKTGHASILGGNLPTGSGTLQTSSSLWSSSAQPMQGGPSLLSSLNVDSSMQHQSPIQGGTLFGGSSYHTGSGASGSSLIGGVPIGGVSSSMMNNGSFGSGNSNVNDIQLLQNLLPGVHITTDSNSGVGGGYKAPSWAAPGPQHSSNGNPNFSGASLHPSQNRDDIGGIRLQGHVGAIGRSSSQQNQRQNTDIW